MRFARRPAAIAAWLLVGALAGCAQSQGQASPQNMAAVAYTAATGTRRWAALYPGTANPQDFGVATVAMASVSVARPITLAKASRGSCIFAFFSQLSVLWP